MQQSALKIDPAVMALLKERTPKYLSARWACEPLLEQALNNVDTVITQGKPSSSLSSLREREVLPSLDKEEEERARALSLEGFLSPQPKRKIIDPGLEEHTTQIRDFGRPRKGRKTDRSLVDSSKGLLALRRSTARRCAGTAGAGHQWPLEWHHAEELRAVRGQALTPPRPITRARVQAPRP